MKLGLTGGIGCGKSTAVGIFAKLGWLTVQSDALVRDLLESDRTVIKALCERWGASVGSLESGIDRKAVAAIVFKDPAELKWLEGLLHPKVREAWENAVHDAGKRNILVEIPLLFEKRLETAFDFTVCVSSPPDVVAARMLARGYTQKEVEQRRLHQWPLSEKILSANFVVSNAGSIEFLEAQITRLVGEIGA